MGEEGWKNLQEFYISSIFPLHMNDRINDEDPFIQRTK